MPQNQTSSEKRAAVWMRTGVGGAVVSSLCCVTPVAVILLGVTGLGAWTGYIDYVALPSLVLSMGLIGYGLYRKKQCGSRTEDKEWNSR